MAVSFLPGQNVPDGVLGTSETIGCGIHRKRNGLIASQPGLLRLTEGKAWLSVQSKRYVPQEGDLVLGIVYAKQGDLFKIDIGTADLANISFLNFEGATKRNRPNLKTGDVLFAKISVTSKHLEPELTCVDQYNRAKGLGIISSHNGIFFKVSLHLARRLLSPQCKLLTLLGKQFKFEITVGLNGRAWLHGAEAKDVAAIRRIILGAEYVLDDCIDAFVGKEVRTYRGLGDTSMDTN